METTILQVPISKALRRDALKAAEIQGFSSIQEAVRVFLKKFASFDIGINFFSLEPKDIVLSAKNDRRYDKMIKDLDSGKVKPKSFTSVKAMMTYLNGNDN